MELLHVCSLQRMFTAPATCRQPKRTQLPGVPESSVLSFGSAKKKGPEIGALWHICRLVKQRRYSPPADLSGPA